VPVPAMASMSAEEIRAQNELILLLDEMEDDDAA